MVYQTLARSNARKETGYVQAQPHLTNRALHWLLDQKFCVSLKPVEFYAVTLGKLPCFKVDNVMDKVYNIEQMLKELPTRTEIQNIVVLNSRPTNQHTNKAHQSTPPTTPDMVCDKSEARPDARATHNSRMSTACDVVGNYQVTEMKLYDTVMTDTESDTPDSSIGSLIIPETQPDPTIEPMSIHETQSDVSISNSPALIQNGNITSTLERSASSVSRTVIPLVRQDHSHKTEDSPVLLSQIVGSQKSSSNGDGFTVVKRKKKRQSMVVGTNKNSSISSNKKCHIFVTRVSANIEDDSVLQYIKTQPLVSNCKLINVSKKGSKTKSFHAIIDIDCIDTVLTPDFWPTGIAVRRYFLKH